MAQEPRHDSRVPIITFLLFLGATIGAVVGLLSIGGERSSGAAARDWLVVPGDSLAYHLRRLDSLEARTAALTSRMDLIQSEAAAVDSLQSSGGLRDLARIRAQLGILQGRADSVDRVILRDPVKALELVVLRNEVEGVREQVLGSVLAIRHDIDRVYDITKWVLGIILVLAVGNLIGPFLSRRAGTPNARG